LLVRVQTALRLRRIAAERSELYAQLSTSATSSSASSSRRSSSGVSGPRPQNPVNAIDLHTQIVLRNANDPDRVLHCRRAYQEETRALLRMITNLLDISKADEGQLAPAVGAIDAGVLVQGVLDELTARAVAVGVRIDADVSAKRLHGDPDLLGRVLANLLDNAIRHAPEGTEIRVSVAKATEGVELRVADAGPGIPQDLREVVFERFRSGTATRTNRGLGLTFCKLAVRAHGVAIWIEDGSPGAVFCVRLNDDDRLA
jgi:signal transduction histidine kinase